WEVAPGWDVDHMLADLARPRAEFKAPEDSSAMMTPDLSAYLAPNGKNAIAVYDTSTGAILRELKGLKDSVTALAVSDDGQVVVAGNGPSRSMWLAYDQKTRTWVRSVSGKDGPGEVIVWELSQGKVRSVFRGHTQPVFSVAVSPDGSTVASASGKEKVL